MKNLVLAMAVMAILLAAAAGCTAPSAGSRPSGASPAVTTLQAGAALPAIPNPLSVTGPAAAPGIAGSARIARAGDVVSVQYTGRYENGTVFDSNMDAGPLEFTLGNTSIIDGLNEAIAGMAEGEEKTVQIPAAKAYGEYNTSRVWTVNRTGPIANTSFVVGKYYSIHNRESGGLSIVRVLDITPSTVTLDGNNPLAGLNFTFTIRLQKITRP